MRTVLSFVVAAVLAVPVLAEEAKAGKTLQAGDAIGAFTVEKCAGAPNDGVEAGKSLCYRCKLGGRPMVMVFARTADDKLASLVTEINTVVAANEAKKLAAFVNLLGADAAGLKTAAKTLEGKSTAAHVALVVPSDQPNGPEEYKIQATSDVTVILAKDGKVVSSHEFAAGKLDKAAIEKVALAAAGLVK